MNYQPSLALEMTTLQFLNEFDDRVTKSGRLVAKAYRAVDRIGNSLWFVDDTPCLIWRSVEGSAAESWPSSPPLQELVCENVSAGGRPVLLGVGMSGRSHWSATIEGDAMTEAIAFDIACRAAQRPERLASTYELDSDWKFLSATEHLLRVQGRNGLQIEIESLGNASMNFSPPNIEIALPIDDNDHQRGQTYRWRYIAKILSPLQ